MQIVFLTYLNRSGSTYLANLLNSAEDVIAFPEAEILVSLFLEDPFGNYAPDKQRIVYLGSLLNTDQKLKYWGLGPEVFEAGTPPVRNIDQFLNILAVYRDRFKPGATVFLFKAERLVQLIRKVNWEQAGVKTTFIALMRDPRAVYASQSRTISPLDGKPLSANPVGTAIQWRKFAGLCRSYERLPGFKLLHYEDLILSGREVINQLSEHLGLDPQSIKPGQGDLYLRIPPDHQAIHEGILLGPVAGKTDEWKQQLTAKETGLIEQTAAVQMNNYGYQVTEHVRDPYLTMIRIIKEIIYFVSALKRIAVYHIRQLL